jgi:hypothetical protein
MSEAARRDMGTAGVPFATLPVLNVPADARPPAELARLVEHESIRVYYEVRPLPGGGYALAENPTTTARFELLRPTYERLLAEHGPRAKVLDLACSPGYFMFKLASVGFEDVTGVDAREDHRDQFALLNAGYGYRGLQFVLSDIYAFVAAEIAAGRRYDICLLYGFLYHTATPVELLRDIRRLCARCLVVDTTLSDRDDASLSVYEEKAEWLSRASTTRISFNPSLRSVPSLLEAAGYARSERIVPDPALASWHPGGPTCDYFFDRTPLTGVGYRLGRLAGGALRRAGLMRPPPGRRAMFLAYP